MHDALAMKIGKTAGQLCNPKLNYALRKAPLGVKMIYDDVINALRTIMKFETYNEDRHRA